MNDDQHESLGLRTRRVVADAAAAFGTSAEAQACAALIDRLDGPLRIAIVGRVKAGKSTLLNALVKDRLAATDAGECTKVLTEYRYSHVYDVEGEIGSERVSLPASRGDDGLDIAIPKPLAGRLDRVVVRWPSSTLRDVTYVDTPGLVSINSEHSARTESALTPADRDQSEADAIVYLLRHVHERDHAFLHAFTDRSVGLGTPLNALGVLSRADEIGAGRLDALSSASRIASRLSTDARLRPLVAEIVPVAALLAQSAASMGEHEASLLRRVAAELAATATVDLSSLDHFRTTDACSLGPAERERLIVRYGLFGLRWIVVNLHAEPDLTTTGLCARLDDLSGVGVVRERIRTHFLPRSDVLKASTALNELRRIARSSAVAGTSAAGAVLSAVDQLEHATLDFARLRALHLISSGVASSDEALIEIAVDDDAIDRASALMSIDHCRTRLEDPMISGPTAELYQLAVRLYEARVVSPHGSGP